jgi:hypothetical protein
MMLKLATVEGLRGDTDAELGHLKCIASNQQNYGFLPRGLVAMALKEQGAVHVVRMEYVSFISLLIIEVLNFYFYYNLS